MKTEIRIPTDEDPIDYLCSFTSEFRENERLIGALLGVQDNIRQAKLIPLEPLAFFACITAQEEAATFLYYALKSKKYTDPGYGDKLHDHKNKVRILILAEILAKNYFDGVPVEGIQSFIPVERKDGRLTLARIIYDEDKEIAIRQDNPFDTVVARENPRDNNSITQDEWIQSHLGHLTPKGYTIGSHTDKLANERNLCLYGNPTKKLRLSSEAEINHFTTNCISIIVMGFLVLKTEKSPELEKLVVNIYEKIKSSKK